MSEMIKRYWNIFKKETNIMFKEFLKKETNKKQRANMWSFSRLVTSFLIPVCSFISILTASSSLFIGSIVITSFGALTDFFDGRSARKYNSYSEYGKKLDQVADKIFSLMIGINLSLFNPLFLIILSGEALIAATNVSYKLKHNDLKITSTLIGKIKQWPLFLSLILGFVSTMNTSLLLTTNISILLTSVFQLATTVSYIKTNNSNIQKTNKKTENNKTLIILEDNSKEQLKKTKTLDNKCNTEIKNEVSIENNEITRLEKIVTLRNVLNEIAITKSNEEQKNLEDFQKIKK